MATAALVAAARLRAQLLAEPRGSPEQVVERLLADDGTPSVGYEEITAAAKAFMDAFPDLTVLFDDLREGPNGWEYHWTLDGTHAETGNHVRVSGCELWDLAALVAAPFKGQGRVSERGLGQQPEPGQASLLWASDSPRLQHVKVLKQAREVVFLEGPILFGVQRRPHGEQLRVDTDQAVELASRVEPASGRVIQRLRSSVRVDQNHSNGHRPIIGHR